MKPRETARPGNPKRRSGGVGSGKLAVGFAFKKEIVLEDGFVCTKIGDLQPFPQQRDGDFFNRKSMCF